MKRLKQRRADRRKWERGHYKKNRATLLERKKNRLAAHRDDINRRRRELHQAHAAKVSKEKLEFFRKNPRALLKLKYVVCLECGAKLDILKGRKGGHLWRVHGMTAEQYSGKWPGAPLVSVTFKRSKARGGRKPKPTLRGHSRPKLKVRGHAADEKPLRKSQIVPLLALGFSYSEIGKRLNRFFTTIASAVKRMGVQSATKEDRQMLAECRAFLRDNPKAGIGELRDWLSEEAMSRKAHNRDGERFARFSALDLGPLFQGKRPGPRGPTKKKAEKQYFKVGGAVEGAIPRFEDLIPIRRKPRKELLELGCSEQEIDAIHMPGSRTAIIAARWFISIIEALPFDVVGEYHRDYLKSSSPG
jgi:hypothetical protein